MSDENPFANLGDPPGDDDPPGQIRYMIKLVEAFNNVDEPRLKPLRAKLYAAITEVGDSTKPEDGERFAARLRGLQLETYELIMIVVNQIRATLRVKLGRAMPKPARLDTERLQKDLGDYAQGLRKLVSAIKTSDHAKRLEANALLEAAGRGIQEADTSE